MTPENRNSYAATSGGLLHRKEALLINKLDPAHVWFYYILRPHSCRSYNQRAVKIRDHVRRAQREAAAQAQQRAPLPREHHLLDMLGDLHVALGVDLRPQLAEDLRLADARR